MYVKVSADEDVRASVRKALEERLKTVSDVELSDQSPDYTISVIVLKVVTRSRRDVGYALSVLVTSPYTQQVRSFADSHVAPELRDQLVATMSEAVKPHAHWVQTASVEELPNVCASIVETFDAQTLSERRKASKATGY